MVVVLRLSGPHYTRIGLLYPAYHAESGADLDGVVWAWRMQFAFGQPVFGLNGLPYSIRDFTEAKTVWHPIGA